MNTTAAKPAKLRKRLPRGFRRGHNGDIPWGYVLSGTVKWQGDDAQDFGAIVITRNKVAVRNGQRSLGRARKVR